MYYDQLERNEDIYKTLLRDSKNAGLQEGLQRGKIEGNTEGKLEVAKTMKRAGMNQDVIQQLTGLSKKEVDKILSN